MKYLYGAAVERNSATVLQLILRGQSERKELSEICLNQF